MVERKSPTSLPTVAVFIVSNGNTAYLKQTLKAVRDSTYPLDSLTIIDTASGDSDYSVKTDDLRDYAPCRFLRIPRANYGKALQTARAKFPESVDYLWMLHDDSAPTVTTLQSLVQYCYNYPDTAVVGPKVFSWNNPEQLLEVGIQATRYGERLNPYDAQEKDQGQYDWRRRVLAVSAAGMLVRAKVWDQLRGFNPALSPYNDGLEFCRRVWLAGYQVAVVPKARIYHAKASFNGIRNKHKDSASSLLTTVPQNNAKTEPEATYLNRIQSLKAKASLKYPFQISTLGLHSPLPGSLASFDYCGYDPNDPDAPRPHQPVHRYDPIPVTPVSDSNTEKPDNSAVERQCSQYFLRAVYQPFGLLLIWLFWQLIFSLLIGILRILAGHTKLAMNHITGVFSVLTNLPQVIKTRKQVRLSRKVSMTVLKSLETNRFELLEQRRLKNKVAKDSHNPLLKLESAALQQLQICQRHCAISTGFLLVGALFITIMMGYPYRFGMHGGAWGILPDKWGDLWQAISAHWIAGGIGNPGVADPILPLLTFFTAPLALFGISINFVIKLIFYFSPALTLFSAWFCSAMVNRHHLPRLILALAWLLNPVFIFSYYSGNLSAIIGCISLPLALFGIFQHYGIGANYLLRGVRKTTYYQPVLGRKMASGIALLSIAALLATSPWMMIVLLGLIIGIATYVISVQRIKDVRGISWQFMRGLVLLIPAALLLLPGFLGSFSLGQKGVQAYLWQTPAYQGQVGFYTLLKTTFSATIYGWGVFSLALILLALAFCGCLNLVNWPRQLPGVGLSVVGALSWISAERTPVGVNNNQVVYAWPATAVALLWLGLLVIAASFLHSLAKQRIYFQIWPFFRVLLVLMLCIGIASLAALGLKESTVLTTKTDFVAGDSVAPNGFSIISQGSQRGRLIVLDRNVKTHVYEIKLWRLPGSALTDTNTNSRVEKISDNHFDRFSEKLASIPAALLMGDSESTVKTALSLGADEILLMSRADTDGKMSGALSTASRVYNVNRNSEYSIWRFDAVDLPQIFSPVRASWQKNHKNTALESGFIQVGQFVKPNDSASKILLHETFNPNWRASLNGSPLKPINIEGQQGFEWPAGKSGYLVINYQNGYWWIWPYLMFLIFGLNLVALIPWSQKKVV